MPTKRRQITVSPSLEPEAAEAGAAIHGSRNAAARYYANTGPTLYRDTLLHLRGRLPRAALLRVLAAMDGRELDHHRPGQQLLGLLHDEALAGADDQAARLAALLDGLTPYERACLEAWAAACWRNEADPRAWAAQLEG